MLFKTPRYTHSVPGDVYIARQDNLELLSSMPEKSVKLIITSPPYNIGKEYEKRTKIHHYISEQSKVISECIRVLDDTGSICWQVGNHVLNGEIFPLDIILYQIFKDHDLKLRNRIVWHFEHGLHCKRRLSGRYETILWFTKGDNYDFNLDNIRVPSKYPNKKHFKGPKIGQISGNPLGKNPGDVWSIPNVKSNHVEKTIHPCQFPVELVERFVLALTNKNDIVLDPYVGVGSSIIAALKHGRQGIGCDIVEEYVDCAWSRVNDFREGRLKTRPMDRPVYDPSKPNGGQK